MDRKEMLVALESRPVRVTMNNGAVHIIEDGQETLVSDISLMFLAKDPEDGKWRHVNLPLVTMSEVVSIAPTA